MIAGTFLAISLVLGACGGCEPTSKRAPHDASAGIGPRPTFTLFALADLRGEIEPCGCTTDPWGDISRTAQLVTDARAQGPVMFVDAGSTLYAEATVPAHLVESAKLKASLIADLYSGVLRADAVALGAADLAFGAEGILMPRLTNVTADGVAAKPYKMVEVAGHKIGVVSVIGPGAIAGITDVPDPADALSKFSAAARSEGAELVVGLLQSPQKKDAQRVLAAAKGLDIAVVGLGNDAPEPDEISRRPERIGETWVVFPAAKGQTLVQFAITMRGGEGFADAIGPQAASLAMAGIDKELATIQSQLAAFRADATADPAFIARKEVERTELTAKREALAQTPLQVPAGGSYFTFDLVPINKKLACDAAVVEKKIAFDKTSGQANLAAAAAMPPVAIPKGQATYVGMAECAACHAPAVAFWKTTRHARAWKTLEDVGKEFNYDCVSCHVVGWMEPGGSTLAKNELLRDVQCETCHGPGSAHVAAGGGKGKGNMVLAPPDDFCASKCHTPEHSDTFDRMSYYRDILGPGHGEAARRALGDGTTGRQLRAAGLAKAGSAIGKGCPK